MKNSVSATNLSKMAFCEASVLRQAKLTPQDQERIHHGNQEHARVEEAIRRSALYNSKHQQLNRRSYTANRPTGKLITFRTITALLLICAICIYFVKKA